MQYDRIRLGMIGANPAWGWAKRTVVPAIQALPEFEITALGTRNMGSAQAGVDAWGAPGARAYTDPRELAADPNVDVVVVSVKTPEHFPLVRTVLEAGKNVICEWPLAANLGEVRELAEIARSKEGLRAFINLQGRAAPTLTYVKDLVEQGYLGRVFSVTLSSITAGWGPETGKNNEYVADKNNGATVLSIPGGHALDGLCYMLGEFTEVSALMATQWPTLKLVDTGETIPKTSADQVIVAGTLEGGAVVSAHIQSGVVHEQGTRVEIHGTEGDIIMTSLEPQLIGRSEFTVLGGRIGGEMEELTVPASYRTAPPQTPKDFSYNVAQFYQLVARDLREGTSLAPDFEMALRRHRMLDAIERAAQTGQRQAL